MSGATATTTGKTSDAEECKCAWGGDASDGEVVDRDHVSGVINDADRIDMPTTHKPQDLLECLLTRERWSAVFGSIERAIDCRSGREVVACGVPLPRGLSRQQGAKIKLEVTLVARS